MFARLMPSMSRPLVAATVLLSSLVAQPLVAQAKVFDPATYTLENGLELVVIPNHRAPIVNHMIWYRVGAADESPGESGLAHFLEHLMFKGTANAPDGEFSDVIQKNGGVENAFTSHDYTAYFQRLPSDKLELMMRYEADRMTNLVLTEEVVDPERAVVREERRSRVGNDPGSQLWEVARAITYLNHPYRRPVIGWDHEVEALNTEQAFAFYRKWYHPNNAIVIVSGDVDPDEVHALAKKYYGAIPRGDLPERARVQEPPQNAGRSATLESSQVRQPEFTISFLAPSYMRGESEHAYALEVLEQVLGGGATSRLYRSLVVEQELAAGASASYSPTKVDLSSFSLSASPRPGVSVEDVKTALKSEITKILRDGVQASEVESAKKRMHASAIYARDSFGTGASVFGRALATGRSVEDVESWPDKIGMVTVEDINAAAKAIFRDEQSVTVTLLPKPVS